MLTPSLQGVGGRGVVDLPSTGVLCRKLCSSRHPGAVRLGGSGLFLRREQGSEL